MRANSSSASQVALPPSHHHHHHRRYPPCSPSPLSVTPVQSSTATERAARTSDNSAHHTARTPSRSRTSPHSSPSSSGSPPPFPSHLGFCLSLSFCLTRYPPRSHSLPLTLPIPPAPRSSSPSPQNRGIQRQDSTARSTATGSHHRIPSTAIPAALHTPIPSYLSKTHTGLLRSSRPDSVPHRLSSGPCLCLCLCFGLFPCLSFPRSFHSPRLGANHPRSTSDHLSLCLLQRVRGRFRKYGGFGKSPQRGTQCRQGPAHTDEEMLGELVRERDCMRGKIGIPAMYCAKWQVVWLTELDMLCYAPARRTRTNSWMRSKALPPCFPSYAPLPYPPRITMNSVSAIFRSMCSHAEINAGQGFAHLLIHSHPPRLPRHGRL